MSDKSPCNGPLTLEPFPPYIVLRERLVIEKCVIYSILPPGHPWRPRAVET